MNRDMAADFLRIRRNIRPTISMVFSVREMSPENINRCKQFSSDLFWE